MLPGTEKLAILKPWAKSNARFRFGDLKSLNEKIFASIAIQKVLFLKFTLVPTIEFHVAFPVAKSGNSSKNLKC